MWQKVYKENKMAIRKLFKNVKLAKVNKRNN